MKGSLERTWICQETMDETLPSPEPEPCCCWSLRSPERALGSVLAQNGAVQVSIHPWHTSSPQRSFHCHGPVLAALCSPELGFVSGTELSLGSQLFPSCARALSHTCRSCRVGGAGIRDQESLGT